MNSPQPAIGDHHLNKRPRLDNTQPQLPAPPAESPPANSAGRPTSSNGQSSSSVTSPNNNATPSLVQSRSAKSARGVSAQDVPSRPVGLPAGSPSQPSREQIRIPVQPAQSTSTINSNLPTRPTASSNAAPPAASTSTPAPPPSQPPPPPPTQPPPPAPWQPSAGPSAFHYKPAGKHDWKITYDPELDPSKEKRHKHPTKRTDGEGLLEQPRDPRRRGEVRQVRRPGLMRDVRVLEFKVSSRCFRDCQ